MLMGLILLVEINLEWSIKYTKCYNSTSVITAMQLQIKSPTLRSIKYKQEKNEKTKNINKF